MNPKAGYYPGLDVVRGLLMVLVVLSHCLPPSLPVFVLFSFHMPLFLGISGFLIKREFICQASVGQIIQKYLFRMLIPWLIAVGVYLIWRISHGVSIRFSEEILYPYYHLWFVPALLAMVLLVKGVESARIHWKLVAVVSLAMCLGWYLFYKEPSDNPSIPWLYWLGDKRLYGYFGFFYLGYLLRSGIIRLPAIPQAITFVVAVISLVVLVGCVYLPVGRVVSFVPYLLLNISLIYTVVVNLAARPLTRNAFVLFCNRQSLAIYLYHYLFFLLLTQWVPQRGIEAWLLFISVLAATVVSTYAGAAISFINKYLFGNALPLTPSSGKG